MTLKTLCYIVVLSLLPTLSSANNVIEGNIVELMPNSINISLFLDNQKITKELKKSLMVANKDTALITINAVNELVDASIEYLDIPNSQSLRKFEDAKCYLLLYTPDSDIWYEVNYTNEEDSANQDIDYNKISPICVNIFQFPTVQDAQNIFTSIELYSKTKYPMDLITNHNEKQLIYPVGLNLKVDSTKERICSVSYINNGFNEPKKPIIFYTHKNLIVVSNDPTCSIINTIEKNRLLSKKHIKINPENLYSVIFNISNLYKMIANKSFSELDTSNVITQLGLDCIENIQYVASINTIDNKVYNNATLSIHFNKEPPPLIKACIVPEKIVLPNFINAKKSSAVIFNNNFNSFYQCLKKIDNKQINSILAQIDEDGKSIDSQLATFLPAIGNTTTIFFPSPKDSAAFVTLMEGGMKNLLKKINSNPTISPIICIQVNDKKTLMEFLKKSYPDSFTTLGKYDFMKLENKKALFITNEFIVYGNEKRLTQIAKTNFKPVSKEKQLSQLLSSDAQKSPFTIFFSDLFLQTFYDYTNNFTGDIITSLTLLANAREPAHDANEKERLLFNKIKASAITALKGLIDCGRVKGNVKMFIYLKFEDNVLEFKCNNSIEY